MKTIYYLSEANNTYYEYARLNKACFTKPAEEIFSTKPENYSNIEPCDIQFLIELC